VPDVPAPPLTRGRGSYCTIRASGHMSEAGTDLRTLSELRGYFRAADVAPQIFFLPPHLRATVRQTSARRLILFALNHEPLRALALLLANRLLLPIAPYHFAIVRPRSAP